MRTSQLSDAQRSLLRQFGRFDTRRLVMAALRTTARRQPALRPRSELPAVRSLVIKVGDKMFDSLGREIGVVSAIASTGAGSNEVQIVNHITREVTRLVQS